MQRGASTERDQDVITFYRVLGTHGRIYEHVKTAAVTAAASAAAVAAAAAISTRHRRWTTMHCHVNAFSISSSSILINSSLSSSLRHLPWPDTSAVCPLVNYTPYRRLVYAGRRQRLMTSLPGSGDVTAYTRRDWL